MPSVLTNEVEMTPAPKASDMKVIAMVNTASTARKIRIEGLRPMKVLRMAQSPAARPLRAMIPRGRNWMKIMMKMIM